MSSALLSFFRFHCKYYQNNSCFFSFILGFPFNSLMLFLLLSHDVLSCVVFWFPLHPLFPVVHSIMCICSPHLPNLFRPLSLLYVCVIFLEYPLSILSSFLFPINCNHPHVMWWFWNCLHSPKNVTVWSVRDLFS